MLPDLAHMLGCSRVCSSHGLLAEGIAFHHLTDRVFHQSRVFAELESKSLQALRHAGVPRGPRRALAHVGLELLLDVELSCVDDWMAHYKRALAEAERDEVCAQISWTRAGHVERGVSTDNTDPGFVPLCRTLLARAGRLRPSTSSEVVERLCRILEPRPRLAIPLAERPKVHTWVDDTWPELVQRLPAWLAELRAGLQPERATHPPASALIPGDPA